MSISNTLKSHYSYDECGNQKSLFEKLDNLKQEGKIDYENEDKYIFKINDIDLTEEEIIGLNKFFDSLDVFPYMDKDDEDWEDENDWEDGFEDNDGYDDGEF